MTFKTLLSVTAAVILAWPAVAAADQKPDPSSRDQTQRQHAGPTSGQGRGQGQGQQPRRSGGGQGQRPNPGSGQRPGRGGGQPAQRRLGPTSHPTGQGGVAPRHGPPTMTARPPANVARLGDWNRAARGPDRQQAAQDWRQGHQGWDGAAPWRRDTGWWRGNTAFQLFRGARAGFYFIPERGYVSIPAGYEQRYWVVGQILPDWLWGYTVRDYWNFGLPQPPDGCAWVWVDNDIALIDTSDGYIIDIVHNAW